MADLEVERIMSPNKNNDQFNNAVEEKVIPSKLFFANISTHIK